MEDHLSKLNSKHLPSGFPREFDAHIYFEASTRQEALSLRERALDFWQGKEVFVGYLIDRPVGPHPIPMFEINFPQRLFSEVTLWLLHHHGNLSILIHELTGDDYLDHTDYAMWIGRAVELDISAFKKKE